MSKKIFVIFSILIGCCFLYLFVSSEKNSQVKIKLKLEESVFKDAQLLQKKDGKIITEIYSKRAVLVDNNQMSLQSITITFPEKEFTIKAQQGLYYTDSSKLVLSGLIEAQGKNFKVYAEEAYWNPQDKTIYSEKPLKIETKKFTIEGNSGKANANLIELNKGVKAVVHIKG